MLGSASGDIKTAGDEICGSMCTCMYNVYVCMYVYVCEYICMYMSMCECVYVYI